MRLLFLTAFVLFLLNSCSHNAQLKDKPRITFTTAYAQNEILPLLGQIDILTDKDNKGAFTGPVRELTGINPDTVKVDMDKYLASGWKNKLLGKFDLNIPHHNADSFNKSVFLGFAYSQDTANMSHILADSDEITGGADFKWVPYNDSNVMALVATTAKPKELAINPADITSIKVQQNGRGTYNKFFDRLMNRDEYCVTVVFNKEASEKIRNSFSDDSVLLVKCTLNNRQFYYSTTVKQIEESVPLGNNRGENRHVLRMRFAG